MASDGRYRRDIDGLRALAILPVLLFHAGVAAVPGGYVGVDIFFVISGFLITGIIAREIGESRFSIIAFYERRARRILPVLAVVIAAVLIAAACLYLPIDFASVPKSALAAVLFVSNVRFFRETGYFQGGAETKPLLHTWSLAIEEQFYIGFPILLLLVARYAPGWRRTIVGGIALISFGLALLTQRNGDGFAFYLLPPRAWELFVGALLAIDAAPAIRARALREMLAWAGLGAITAAVLCYDRHTIFPGTTALVPVLGAAALIHCAPDTFVGRLLSTRPLVAVGLISYSLYMWHWPLIVFVDYVRDAPLHGWWSAGVIAAAFALAALSWRFIETPFRRRQVGRRVIFRASGAAMASLAAASLAMIGMAGWPARFPSQMIRLADGARDISPDRQRCHDPDPTRGKPACVLGAEAAPTALLWGDSHGVELSYALSEIAARHGQALIERTQSSCPPLAGYDPPDNPRCGRANREIEALIRGDPALHTIYLAAFWESYRRVTPGYLQALDRTIGALVGDGRRVVLIGPVPANPWDVPRHLAHLTQFGVADITDPQPWIDAAPAERDLRTLAARWEPRGVLYVSPVERLCRGGACRLASGGHPLYFDSHHLSVTGAREVLAGWTPADDGGSPTRLARR